jgi:hypothetical protein
MYLTGEEKREVTAMDRHDDEDDFYDLPPPPKKSGASGMLILGIVLGAAVLLILLVVVCGGAFFFARVGPDAPQQAPDRHESGAMDKGGPATKPAPAKNRDPEEMKAK